MPLSSPAKRPIAYFASSGLAQSPPAAAQGGGESPSSPKTPDQPKAGLIGKISFCNSTNWWLVQVAFFANLGLARFFALIIKDSGVGRMSNRPVIIVSTDRKPCPSSRSRQEAWYVSVPLILRTEQKSYEGLSQAIHI